MNKLVIATLLASVAFAGQAAHAETPAAGERTDRPTIRAEMVERMQELGREGFTEKMREQAAERFDSLDADGSGTITREEFLAATGDRAEEIFQRMGPDEDGVVTRSARERGGFGRHHRAGPRAERSGGMRGMRGMDAEQRAERLSERAAEEFARLDADGDGMISLQEFEAGMQARFERFSERRDNRGERMEQRAERRGEGRHRGMRGEGRAEMRGMHGQMRAMMRDGMSLDDFSGLMEERATARFDALDADGDGEITRDEFLASVEQRAERAFARMERMEAGERPRRGSWHHRRGPAAE